MDFAEKRLIKEYSLKKNLRQRLERAKYNFFKGIEKRGGVFENAGAEQARDLSSFKISLESLSIDSTLRKCLINEINSFIDFMDNYSGTNEQVLKEARRVIKSYERKDNLKAA